MRQYLECLAFDGGPHLWSLRSEHSTSQGVLKYFGCPCGRWDVELRSLTVAEVRRSGWSSDGSVPASSTVPYPLERVPADPLVGIVDQRAEGHAETHR